MDREKTVKIFGEEFHLNADVVVLHSMSAHADADELTNYCKKLNIMQIKKAFLVHGDYDQQQLFSQHLKKLNIKDVEIPDRGDSFEI